VVAPGSPKKTRLPKIETKKELKEGKKESRTAKKKEKEPSKNEEKQKKSSGGSLGTVKEEN